MRGHLLRNLALHEHRIANRGIQTIEKQECLSPSALREKESWRVLIGPVDFHHQVQQPPDSNCLVIAFIDPNSMPILEAEVAADAIHWAAHHERAEIFVGWPTVAAIEGNKIAPRLADRLSRTYRIRISANGGAGGSPHRPQVFDLCLTSFYFASLEQVIESADSIPAVAVGLEQ